MSVSECIEGSGPTGICGRAGPEVVYDTCGGPAAVCGNRFWDDRILVMPLPRVVHEGGLGWEAGDVDVVAQEVEHSLAAIVLVEVAHRGRQSSHWSGHG